MLLVVGGVGHREAAVGALGGQGSEFGLLIFQGFLGVLGGLLRPLVGLGGGFLWRHPGLSEDGFLKNMNGLVFKTAI